jgi:hypothetical protein
MPLVAYINFYRFSERHWKNIRTSNVKGRLFREEKDQNGWPLSEKDF